MNATLIDLFMRYAADFELSYVDDDWTRVYPYLNSDASYEIIGEPVACVLHGPENIFAGIKKSLDGFDRRFDERRITPKSDFVTTNSSLSIDWEGAYLKKDCPDLIIAGKSTLHFDAANDAVKIARFSDQFAADSLAEFEKWTATTGLALDISYT